MNSVVRTQALAWLAQAVPAIVVEVAEARGSVPRGIGTRMLVSADDSVGTIGGGHLELQAISAARARLARGDRQRHQQRYALGPSLGQCCGGAVGLAFAPLDAAALARWPAVEPLFRLQLHGAGHVGRAIATLLATLDCSVDWFDQRDEEFPATTTLGSPWPAHIRRISVDTVEAEVGQAEPGAFFLVLTHEHALDLRIAEAILRRADFAFFGLIGSRTKRATFARRLEERGIAAATVARMACPIGLPGIAGKEPEVIAAGVVAQLLSERRRAMGTMPADEAAPAHDRTPALDGGGRPRILAAPGPVRRRDR
ncbi:MAG: xanthine dehydrogenase accessory protein XdhC [Caldimonas sp.]